MLFLEKKRFAHFLTNWKLLKRFGNLPYSTLYRSLIDNLPTIQLLHWLIVISSVPFIFNLKNTNLYLYMLLDLNIIGCLQEQIWDLLLNSQEIYWKVWHLLTSSLGIRREYFWVLISYKMRKVLNYNWKLWIYSSPSQSSPVQSSPVQFNYRR